MTVFDIILNDSKCFKAVILILLCLLQRRYSPLLLLIEKHSICSTMIRLGAS